jgi:RNA polymerase sigma-70 factor (ECF subfamily)
MAKTGFLSSLFSLTDEQAMWRVQMQDDHDAFARLMARWDDPIRRLCIRMTGDMHRGEDLKQETFVRAFARRRDFKTDHRFSTWLWRIALNLCYDELRRVQRRREQPADGDGEDLGGFEALVTDAPAPDAQMVADEEADLVRRALLRLPENYRAVLVLRHYENLKIREIAEILEIPEGTVNWRLTEGLSQMQCLLEVHLAKSKPKHRPTRKHQTEMLAL